MSLPVDASAGQALALLSRFRVEFYECLYARSDALFELSDAVLCADGPVKTLVELSLAVEHGVGTAPCTPRWTGAGWSRPDCVARWPACRCRRRPTDVSWWPWM
jgi:hypothetical protein